MSRSEFCYELSEASEIDLGDIFDYTLSEFGIEQAEKYTLEFEIDFGELTRYPELGIKRDEIKPGLRSILKESHVIFYRILDDRIRIVRILHQRKDLQQFRE